tara:strand:- start:527 stop:1264 length:738 start_codon:yes stop_codon:yes gene_type:complete
MKKTLLIDGDIVAYQHATKVETPIHWGDEIWTLHADAKECKMRIRDWLKWAVEETGVDDMLIYLSSTENFRKDLAESYKANRKDKRKPIILTAIREWMLEEFDAIILPRLEADDAIGIALTSGKHGDCIAASIDKDFDTIPGKHFNWNAKNGIREISTKEADRNFFRQALTGDSTDNYGGCPGIGPKKADKILDGAKDYWEAVLAAYQKAGLGLEIALTQARLARILRHGEYNMKTNKIKLWRPA